MHMKKFLWSWWQGESIKLISFVISTLCNNDELTYDHNSSKMFREFLEMFSEFQTIRTYSKMLIFLRCIGKWCKNYPYFKIISMLFQYHAFP